MKKFNTKAIGLAIDQLLAQINEHVINSNNIKFKDLKAGNIKFVNKLETINKDQLEQAIAKYATITKTDERLLALALVLVNDLHNYTFQVICKKATIEAYKNREAWKAEHHPSERSKEDRYKTK